MPPWLERRSGWLAIHGTIVAPRRVDRRAGALPAASLVRVRFAGYLDYAF